MKRNIDAVLKENTVNKKPSRPSTDSIIAGEKSHFETNGDNTIISAKAEFLRRVSNSISYLIDRHGYSRLRASELILGEIRKGSPLPSEDEIFSVMEKYHLGTNEALEAIVISNALKKICRDQNLSVTKAIENLTSSLTTMKLLSKVESQNQVSLNQGDAVSSNCPSQASCSSSSAKVTARTSSPKIFLSTVEKKNEKSGPTAPSIPMPSETAFTENISSRKRSDAEPSKILRKRGKDQDKTSSKSSTKDDDDADLLKVTHRVILQKQEHNSVPPPSSATPSINNNRTKSSSPREKRKLETNVEDQPTAKRQRLDSI